MEHSAKYEYLEDSESMNTMNDHQLMLQAGDEGRKSGRRLRLPLTWLVSYYVLSSTIILILLGITVTRVYNESESYEREPYFRGVFGRNWKYMSVDHRYDHLWEDLAGESAVFNLPDPRVDGEEKLASLAM